MITIRVVPRDGVILVQVEGGDVLEVECSLAVLAHERTIDAAGSRSRRQAQGPVLRPAASLLRMRAAISSRHELGAGLGIGVNTDRNFFPAIVFVKWNDHGVGGGEGV